MINVDFYHLNDELFDRENENISLKVNLDEFIPLNANYDEKVKNIKAKYTNKQSGEYTLIANTTFFSTVRDFVYSNLPLLIESMINDTKLLVRHVILNNPPDKVYQAFLDRRSQYSVENIPRKSFILNKESLIAVKNNLNKSINGQENVKKHILVNLSKYLYSNTTSPLILAFIGPQGVGKTEMARVISDSLFEEGHLFREQMSMLTNAASQDYLFGSDTSSRSFSKNLLQRRSNVLLLDEFNLINPNFYGAFYQMFDEGKFVDGYYTVNLDKTIIICTGNYMSKQEMVSDLGAPLYSRFNDICVFDKLSVADYLKIAESKLNNKIKNLKSEYQKKINKNKILEKIQTLGEFSDVRSLDHVIDQLIDKYLLELEHIL
jgi:ATPases with chaperone activity, ATP-binding subunit